MFQSTVDCQHISIHAPREGCDPPTDPIMLVTDISIHAPREGCDTDAMRISCRKILFQSTHPVRGATGGLVERYRS